jgi:hypothetical protein
LLVSSYQCNPPPPQPQNCQYVNAVLRYVATQDADYGQFDGIHIADVPGPFGMAIHPTRGTLLVVSQTTHSVREYNLHSGVFIRTLVSPGPEGLHRPQSIVFTPWGNILVTSTQTEFNLDKLNGVAEFDGDTGEFVRVFVEGGSILSDTCERPPSNPTAPCLRLPAGMAYAPDLPTNPSYETNLFVVSNLNDRVIEFDATTGEFVRSIADAKLLSPNELTFRSNGNLMVTSLWRSSPTDTGDKVLEFTFNNTTMNWQLVSTYANPGVFYGQVINPGPLLFESDAVLLLSDRVHWSNFLSNFSDRIRRNNATTGLPCTAATCANPGCPGGAPASCHNYFTSTDQDLFLHYCTGLLLTNLGCTSDASCNDYDPCTNDFCNTDGTCTYTSNVPCPALSGWGMVIGTWLTIFAGVRFLSRARAAR